MSLEYQTIVKPQLEAAKRDEHSESGAAAGSESCCYESVTIMALRIVEFMQTYSCDAEMVLSQFVGDIGPYERDLMEREGIELRL